ncbi:hypothetical protein J31TS4_40010 [Paenibacillus sp. J31TS4]|uniref:hypothetical protein n=1 Tax=Paenibacillus sp. J31TS4 TaxID=2807195 RepID=UPI001B243436|nr:hypothetical protein [Paenibacillus sp. J31TS4]GIP40721.1 hypothetical protein J31TS4_40010 [Paenibacillus sp. J31TS4]
MSAICPVCNGLEREAACCLACGTLAEDCGRFSDWLGPYAPYREQDDIAMTDGFPGAAQGVCTHTFSCPACGWEFQQAIALVEVPADGVLRPI